MSRKYILALILLLTLCADNAWPATSEDARRFVDNLGKEVIAVINSSGLSEVAKHKKLQDMFAQNVDIDWMAKFVLGQGWRSANLSQRKRYMEAYREYLIKNYTKNFSDYTGSKYNITDIKSESDGYFTVAMSIKTNTEKAPEINAGYRLKPDGSTFKIMDIIVEGASLITTQRADFSSVLRQSGLDQLISNIEAKTNNFNKGSNNEKIRILF